MPTRASNVSYNRVKLILKLLITAFPADKRQRLFVDKPPLKETRKRQRFEVSYLLDNNLAPELKQV